MYKKGVFLGIFILIFATNFICRSNLAEDISVYTLHYSLETETVEIDAAIPVLDGLKNEAAQEEYNQKLRDNIINFTDNIKEQGDQFLKELIKADRPSFKYQAYVIYEVKNKEKILSLLLNYYQYTGGAHGLTGVFSHNLDPVTGKELTFLDLLGLFKLELEQVKNNIISEIEEAPENYFSDALEYIKNKDEFNCYIEDNFLIVYFQQYEIAPYSAGNPEFKIPLY